MKGKLSQLVMPTALKDRFSKPLPPYFDFKEFMIHLA
jgi:hypothetical protein